MQDECVNHAFAISILRCATLLATYVASANAYAAGPLPQGGKFVAGAGTMQATGNTLEVQQSSTRAVIDWRSFSIGEGNRVDIQNGSGATLGRVTGAERSVIDGALNSTGSVYLINPQGVLIGRSGIVTTGGRFVASALDVDNHAFMENGSLTATGDGHGRIVNLGRISSKSADVFLISRDVVVNAGSISAPSGTVELATGSELLLKDSSTSTQVYVKAGSGGKVIDKGAINAAQISLQAVDGNVYALAGRHGELRATGTATRDGHIWLVAENGRLTAHDRIDASNADGSGGTVAMQAKTFDLRGVTVDAGRWNIRTPEVTLSPNFAATLASNLSRGTSIEVMTTDRTGDITLLSGLGWRGNASLTLNAGRSVFIGPQGALSNTGSGNLVLRADAAGADNGGGFVNRGAVDWSKSTGNVSILRDMNGSYVAGTWKSNPLWQAAAFSGLKTQFTAYRLVNSMADLMKVGADMSGVYALGKDIDAGSTKSSISPLGLSTGTSFTGEFDGIGHASNNLVVNNLQEKGDGNDYAGLFAVIGKNGVVRNLTLDNGQAFTFFSTTGILAGRNDGLITYVRTSGSVRTGTSFDGSGGGLVGQNSGTIERSGSSADVGFSGLVGGLVSKNTGFILQSYATGSSGGGSHSEGGGLAGANDGVIMQSYATGTGGGISGGGLVGGNGGAIIESFATGDETLTPYPAGVVAFNSGFVANNVFWDKQSSGVAVGADQGTAIPAANGLTTAQMSMASSFGPTWSFGINGTWALPVGATHPVLRWEGEH